MTKSILILKAIILQQNILQILSKLAKASQVLESPEKRVHGPDNRGICKTAICISLKYNL